MKVIKTQNLHQLVIPHQKGFLFINIEDIIYCRSQGNYSEVYKADGRYILATNLLKEVEELLGGHTFLRIHRSFLVNIRYVSEYLTGKQYIVKLTDGTVLPASKSGISKLKKL